MNATRTDFDQYMAAVRMWLGRLTDGHIGHENDLADWSYRDDYDRHVKAKRCAERALESNGYGRWF